jgi:GNAT superfamily N-acetyltransferase
METVDARVVGPADADPVAETLALAFFADPVWSWVFGDPTRRHEQLVALWGLFVAAAVDHGWVWTTPGYGAATLWIPPGRPELAEPYASQLAPLLDGLVGPRAALVTEVFERFEAAHPHDEDHFYLSLFGTHPDHRGRGIGMGLLAANLARIDDAGMPAYLESSNPANDRRSGSVGFERHGEFTLPDGGPTVTTMWRPARAVG